MGRNQKTVKEDLSLRSSKLFQAPDFTNSNQVKNIGIKVSKGQFSLESIDISN